MANKKVFTSFLWRFFECCGTHGVTLVVSMVLARMLGPDVFGALALVSVFINILRSFVNSGLGSALIQKKDADTCDFSSVFYFNLGFSVALYGLLFVSAPFLAEFYHKPELTSVIRVLGVTLVFYGVTNVQRAYVSRHLLFRTLFWVTMLASLMGAFIGIGMAYKGSGIWALVAQQLIHNGVVLLGLGVFLKWHPTFEYSWRRLKGLLNYGWKLLVSALVDRSYTELRSLIIGRLYTPADLAFFNRGMQFPNLAAGNINDAIDSVVFPTMSSVQDDRPKVKKMTRKAIQLSTCIVAPLMVGLAAAAIPLVRLILADQWLPCVPYLRIFCISFLFRPIHTANLNAIKALGRSDLFLILEVVKKILGMILILGSMRFGVLVMAYTYLLQSFLAQVINAWPNHKLLNYNYLEQLRDIFPYLLLSVLMGGAVYAVSFLALPDWQILGIQTILGAIIYWAGLALLKLECYGYIQDILRQFRRRREADSVA